MPGYDREKKTGCGREGAQKERWRRIETGGNREDKIKKKREKRIAQLIEVVVDDGQQGTGRVKGREKKI